MKKSLHISLVQILFLVTIFLQSCSDEKFTVWTETETYTQFYNSTQVTINDGYYIRLEIPSDQWKEMSKNLTSEGRHRWSEEEINAGPDPVIAPTEGLSRE